MARLRGRFLHRFANRLLELLNPFIEGGGDGQHGRFTDFAFEFLQVLFGNRLVHLVRDDDARSRYPRTFVGSEDFPAGFEIKSTQAAL